MNNLPLSYAGVSSSALIHNYRILRGLVPTDVRILTLLKSDAYGHGAVWAGRLLEAEGVDYFGVATAEEGFELRDAGIRTPILILGYTSPGQIPEIARRHIAQCVPDVETAQLYAAQLSDEDPELIVHIKLDTGMARYGLDCRDIDAATREALAIAQTPRLYTQGLFTHFADADNAADAYTPVQAERFQQIYNNLINSGIKIPIAHCENSAAVLKYNCIRFDMVRVGISLYGIAPSPATPIPDTLRTVMSLHTTVVQTRTLPPDESVSYGRRFITQRPTVVATLRIGYADGLFRLASSGGKVLIRGQLAPIIGTVCMDACMVDVTDIPGVCRGDDVLIFGRSENQVLPPDDLAAVCQTIPYELISRIGPRIPRIEFP